MEHLALEVLHQSECHVPLELSLATSLVSENVLFFAHCVLAQTNQSCGDQGGREVRVMVKSLGFAHASPKKTIALGSDCGDTNKVQFFRLFIQSSHEDQSEAQRRDSKVARETLDAIHNEAFNEIIEKLLHLVEKILIIACMIDNEYYFKKRGVLSKDWLHATIVQFSGVPKSEMMTILLVARRQTPMCIPWAKDMLLKADKFYQLRGIERLFMYMGNLLLGDPLPSFQGVFGMPGTGRFWIKRLTMLLERKRSTPASWLH